MEGESTAALTPALFSAVDLNPAALSPTNQGAETLSVHLEWVVAGVEGGTDHQHHVLLPW